MNYGIEGELLKAKIKKNLNSQWTYAKDKLSTGEIRYNELEKILELDFFDRFDDILKSTSSKTMIRLQNISLLMRFTKGIEDNDGNLYDINRFIPNSKYASLNRFNPPGEVFIYLGISLKRDLAKVKDEVDYITQTCIREIRAFGNDNAYVSSLNFNYSRDNKNIKLIDLTIADKYNDLDDIVDEIVKLKMMNENERNKMGYKYKNKISNLFAMMDIKLISDEIFKPVITNDDEVKKYEYAPFHSFANYIRSRGYGGIVYSSTMNKGGKNVVIFNVEDVEPNTKDGISKYIIKNDIIEKI